MGNSRAGHFNAQFKDTFGWLPAGSVRVHGGGTATYTIGALEAPGPVHVRGADPDDRNEPTRTYWIEWRNRDGLRRGGAGHGRERRAHPASRRAPSAGPTSST